MLLRCWLRAPNGRDGRSDLRGSRGMLLRRRLGLVLHMLHLLLLHLLKLYVLQLLLHLLLINLLLEMLLLLQMLLHVVLKMLLLHLLLYLLMHLMLMQLLLLHLLHLLLLELLHLVLLALHGGADLRRRRRRHHVCAHRAYQRSCNVCRHVWGNGNRSYNLIHWQSHGQGFWSNCPGKGLLKSRRRCRYRRVLRKRTIQNEGGRQICGCQCLLNRTNCLGLSRFCSSLRLEEKLIVFSTEKTLLLFTR